MSGDGSDDLVLWVMHVAAELLPTASSAELLRIEQRIRLHWGGRRPYIPKVSAADRAGSLRSDDLDRG